MDFYFYEEKEAAANEELERQVLQLRENKAAFAALCNECPLNGTRCRDRVWCPAQRRMDEQCEVCSSYHACLGGDWCPGIE